MSTGIAPNNGSMCCGCNSYTKSLSQIQAISSDLVCDKDGEERVIIACHYRKASNFKKINWGSSFWNQKRKKA